MEEKDIFHTQRELLELKNNNMRAAMAQLNGLQKNLTATVEQIKVELGIPEDERKLWRMSDDMTKLVKVEPQKKKEAK